MRVEQDVKLTFEDVLIRPKRSTLVSRSDVTLEREFKFRHSSTTWTGVPIVAANMDTTGLFSISKILLAETLYCFPPVSIIANDINFHLLVSGQYSPQFYQVKIIELKNCL